MGHYASEMDPNWNSRDREIEQILAAGFKAIYVGQKDLLECPKCGALTIDWRKHQAVCGKVAP